MIENDISSALLLFPMADGQTGPAIQTALDNLGVHVESADPLQTPPERLLEACNSFGGDLVLCGRERVLAENAGALRAASGAKFMVVWNPDVRYDLDEWEPLLDLFRFPVCSAYYTVGMGNLVKWRNIGVNAWWLPQGLQPELYHAPESLSQEDWGRYGCDVSFIGGEYGMHDGRGEVLDALQASGLDVKIWGCRGAPEVWGEEHNKAVACSKVCLCHSGWPANQFYWSVRAYKVMGAGGFVLANNHTGMAKWLPISGPNRILDNYGSVEECLEKVRYWIENDEERQAIAERGRGWAGRNTYTDRIRAMLHQLSSGKYFGDEQVFNPRDLTPLVEKPFNWIFEEAENAKGPDTDGEIHQAVAASNSLSPPVRGCGLKAGGTRGQDRPGPAADEAGADEQGGGRRFLTTVGDQTCEEGILYLLLSLRKTGWLEGGGEVRILTPQEEKKRLTRECEVFQRARREGIPEESIQLVEVPSWHEEFAPDADFMYYNSCYLKLFAMQGLEDGDRVLFVDGADTLIMSDPGRVLDLLNMAPLLWVPAEPDRDDPLIPGFCALFDLDPADRTRANDGVFAFEVCAEARQFFSLWRAFSAWSICYGLGDMTAFNLALTVYAGQHMPLTRQWNYLAAYSDSYRTQEGSLLAEDGTEVHILHGAGSGREKFLRVRDQLFQWR